MNLPAGSTIMHNNKQIQSIARYSKSEEISIPYAHWIGYSLKLSAKPRRGGGNMFRHQMETLAILLDYGFRDPRLLKAALIHDLIEDIEWTDLDHYEEIERLDDDGVAVLQLVKEVSQHAFDGVKEPKGEFLLRIMKHGSHKAKILKIADRISNLTGLPLSGDQDFIRNYISETEQYIAPYASQINPGMAQEINERLKSIKRKFLP